MKFISAYHFCANKNSKSKEFASDNWEIPPSFEDNDSASMSWFCTAVESVLHLQGDFSVCVHQAKIKQVFLEVTVQMRPRLGFRMTSEDSRCFI